MKGWNAKYLLKRAGERLLPVQILQRKKQGFVVPIASWFKDEMRDYLQDILLSPRFAQRGYLNPNMLEQLIRAHQKGK